MGRRPKIVVEFHFLRDRARDAMGRFKIRAETYDANPNPTNIARAITYDEDLLFRLHDWTYKLGEPTMGRLAAIGRSYGSPDELKELPMLRDVAPRYGDKDWLAPEVSPGLVLLHKIAMTSLIAAIGLNIHEDLRRAQRRG